MSPDARRLHDGLIRAAIMAVRAWQDWLKAQPAPEPQQPQQEPKQALQ